MVYYLSAVPLSDSTANVSYPTELACVASVSVGLESKESQRNGIFDVLPARKMVREPNPSPTPSFVFWLSPHFSRGKNEFAPRSLHEIPSTLHRRNLNNAIFLRLRLSSFIHTSSSRKRSLKTPGLRFSADLKHFETISFSKTITLRFAQTQIQK